MAFWVIGVAGLVFAPVVKLTLKDPTRAKRRELGGSVPVGQCVAFILGKPSLLLMLAAGACGVAGFSGLTFWMPSLLVRSYDLSVLQASQFFSLNLLVGGIAGLWLGGWGADKFGPQRKGSYALVAAAGYFVGVPPLVGLFFHTSVPVTFMLLFVPCAAGLLGTAPIISTIQHLVPANMRSTTAGIMTFVNSMFGHGIIMPLMGALSDANMHRLGDDSLLISIGMAAMLNLLAVVFLLFAAPKLKRDWIE
jgi:sugar phosphate permease